MRSIAEHDTSEVFSEGFYVFVLGTCRREALRSFFSDFGIVAPEINEFFCDAIGKLKSLNNFPDFIGKHPLKYRYIQKVRAATLMLQP